VTLDVASPPAGDVPVADREVSIAGLPPGVRPAPPKLRLLAQVLDSWFSPLLLVLALFVAARLPQAAAGMVAASLVLLAALWAGFVWFLLSTQAAGPGMRLARLQLVGLQDGLPVGWLRVLLRAAVWWALAVSVIGLVAMLVERHRHPRGQGWHDLAADSLVICERRHVGPGGGEQRPAGRSEDREPASGDAPGADDQAAPGTTWLDPTLSWAAVLDDGRAIPLGQVHLLGRNPTADIGEEAVRVVVDDPSRTVSQTHLEMGLANGIPYVRDRGSTNGSTLTTASGLVMTCPPGRVLPVGADALVTFGDRHLRVRQYGPAH
jgi:uncharacterized RDD family membrane protein YckC